MPTRKRPLPPEPSKKAVQPSEPEAKPKEMKVEPRLFTVQEVAARMSTSVGSVREMERAGLLKRVPILGRAHVFDVVDVDLLIDAAKTHGRQVWKHVGKKVVFIRPEVNALLAIVEKLKEAA